MRNVSYELKGTKLIITVDVSKRLGPSKSGKSEVIASTEGNQSVAAGDAVVKFGVNVYTSPKQA